MAPGSRDEESQRVRQKEGRQKSLVTLVIEAAAGASEKSENITQNQPSEGRRLEYTFTHQLLPPLVEYYPQGHSFPAFLGFISS